jgi:hypothetical protein
MGSQVAHVLAPIGFKEHTISWKTHLVWWEQMMYSIWILGKPTFWLPSTEGDSLLYEVFQELPRNVMAIGLAMGFPFLSRTVSTQSGPNRLRDGRLNFPLGGV